MVDLELHPFPNRFNSYYQTVTMNSWDVEKPELRGEITSLCRETAKSLDMERNGSRWKCEVTNITITDHGVKKYSFYIHDKNSGNEYQAEAHVENGETAKWNLETVENTFRN